VPAFRATLCCASRPPRREHGQDSRPTRGISNLTGSWSPLVPGTSCAYAGTVMAEIAKNFHPEGVRVSA
jgi:hypothetical protein